jgi:hypothetical protein
MPEIKREQSDRYNNNIDNILVYQGYHLPHDWNGRVTLVEANNFASSSRQAPPMPVQVSTTAQAVSWNPDDYQETRKATAPRKVRNEGHAGESLLSGQWSSDPAIFRFSKIW